MSSQDRRNTKPIPSPDNLHNDLRILWSSDKKRILVDNRPEEEQK